MRGIGVFTVFGDRGELMASEHEWRHEASWLQQSPGPAPSSVIVQVPVEQRDEEHQILSLLLKVFPGMSLESIAQAYTRAEGDPNSAAEILAIESSTSHDSGQSSDGHAVNQELGKDADFFGTSEKPLGAGFHFEENNEQLNNGGKENAASVVSRDAPGVHNHSGRPPEENPTGAYETREEFCQSACSSGTSFSSSFARAGSNGVHVMRKSPTKGSIISTAAGNCASSGTGNGFHSHGNSLLPGWKGFSNGHKLSAISGTVSCHRQRRNEFSYNDLGKDSKDCREGDELFYNGKQRKKKKGGMSNNEDNGNTTDAASNQRAAEDFLHSMLGDGFELGIDVVRDVLDHFSWDTNKALETLLHMASKSSGFQYTELSDQVSEPLQYLIQVFPNKDPAEVLIAFQECDEDLVQATNALLQKELVLKDSSVTSRIELQPGFERVLSKLHERFPTVELSCLSEILQASDCSYGSAVQALKEAGMVPVNEKGSSKVDPAEVLQALFRTDTGPPIGTEPAPELNTTSEVYTVVATRARGRSCISNNKAEIDEYEKHRGSANDHWSTMKRYFQEAAAAHGRGERALAGVLSQKGQLFKGLAREASLRASENIFNVKNRDIENNITIDLHAQHVHEAIRLLKLHLRSLSSISSVDTLTVITGHGSHSAGGRAKIKPALTQYLAKMHIPWAEPNAGCLMIKMSDVKGHAAGHRSSDSSSDSEIQVIEILPG